MRVVDEVADDGAQQDDGNRVRHAQRRRQTERVLVQDHQEQTDSEVPHPIALQSYRV